MKRDKLLFLVIVGLFIWVVGPHLLYLLDTNADNNTSINNTDSQKANLVNQYRVTFTQAFVGIAVLYGVYQTWQRISIAENNLRVSQEGQITERFTRAIEQLGNPAIEIRLGGIYSLERIANESDKDCLSIMKILTAYIRVNSYANEETLKPGEIREDIQAILTIIGKQKYSFNSEEFTPNLRGTRLCGADLKGANLERAKLMGVHLEGAHLEGARLEEAYLTSETRLEKAHLEEAHLEKAHLSFAVLYEADLEEAHLEGANLVGALLMGADLSKAHLEGAKLEGAKLNSYEETLLGTTFRKPTILRGAHLEGADFHFANLEDADIRGAHLEKAKNLVTIQP